MKTNRMVVLFASFLFFAANASAVEISMGHLDAPGCVNAFGSSTCVTLVVEGEILKGDVAKLRNAIDVIPAKFEKLRLKARVGSIFLDSPGGNLHEGMSIGRLIRKEMISTQVTFDSSCNSSCVVAFLGGVQRVPVGQMGIHSFFSKEFIGESDFSEASKDYNKVATEVEQYLRELRIPISLLDEMKKVPHYNVKVLEFEDLERFGVLGIDPVYAQIKDKSSQTTP